MTSHWPIKNHSPHRVILRVILLSLLASCWVTGVFGQIPDFENNGIQVFGEPGNPKINIYVWGQAQTGIWSVDEDTDLLEFASLVTAGGFRSNRPDQEVDLFIQLFRDGRLTQEPFYEKNVEDLFASRSYPELQSGDILVLKERVRRRFTWRDVSQVIGTVTSTLSLVLLIDRLRRD
jgi:hypothetical protein